jgi:hypothetical protein
MFRRAARCAMIWPQGRKPRAAQVTSTVQQGQRGAPQATTAWKCTHEQELRDALESRRVVPSVRKTSGKECRPERGDRGRAPGGLKRSPDRQRDEVTTRAAGRSVCPDGRPGITRTRAAGSSEHLFSFGTARKSSGRLIESRHDLGGVARDAHKIPTGRSDARGARGAG